MSAAVTRPSGRAFVRVPMPDAPDALFDAIADEPYSFFLDSSIPEPRLGRHAFMGSRPFLVFTARGRRWTVREGGRVTRGNGDPFLALRGLLAVHRHQGPGSAPPLLAGAVGWVSYEAGRLVEPLRVAPRRASGLPDLCFAFYETVAACDLPRRELSLATGGLAGPRGDLGARQAARAAALLERLRLRTKPGEQPSQFRRTPELRARPRQPFRLTSPLESTIPRAAYLRAVESIRHSIAIGDIYQADLTRQLAGTWEGDPWTLARRLRAVSPAPFSAYLNFGGVRVVSSSPERFLALRGRRIETRPIKGTRPRGVDQASDRALALELVRSEKDMAEHMMIVDVERNDLGRICESGSVTVPEPAALEVFPQVFHLTSTVEGRLRRGLTAVDALRAMVPGGSIAGAPKIRAQEILAGLEPGPRGLYTGALGYVSFSGACDFSIVIRTVVLQGSHLSAGIGGGIVADSDPDREWEETEHKARGLRMALGEAAAARATGVPA
ncbi:MAG: aminodeoxychorismate synthase component I [Candidatus Coatesbacteria bacterium]